MFLRNLKDLAMAVLLSSTIYVIMKIGILTIILETEGERAEKDDGIQIASNAFAAHAACNRMNNVLFICLAMFFTHTTMYKLTYWPTTTLCISNER